jgi:hypothetical protein
MTPGAIKESAKVSFSLSFLLQLVGGLMAGVLAAPVSAQAVGVGVYTDAAGSQPVAEVAMAKAAGPFSVNALLTFDGLGPPMLQPQLGLALTPYLNLDVGASSSYQSINGSYEPWEPHFAATGTVQLVGPFRLVGTLAWQPWAEWARSSVLKIELSP